MKDPQAAMNAKTAHTVVSLLRSGDALRDRENYELVCSCGATTQTTESVYARVWSPLSSLRCCGCGTVYSLLDYTAQPERSVESWVSTYAATEGKPRTPRQKEDSPMAGYIDYTKFAGNPYSQQVEPLAHTKATVRPTEAAIKHCFDYVDALAPVWPPHQVKTLLSKETSTPRVDFVETLAPSAKAAGTTREVPRTIRDMKPGEYGYISLHLVGKDPCMSAYVNPEPGGVACVRIKRARSGYMIDPGDRDTPASCGCNDFIFTETGGAKWCRKCGATWMRGEFARWRRVVSKHKTAPKKTPQVATKDKTVRDLQYGETGYITGVAYVRKDLDAPVRAEPSTLYSYHVRRRNHGLDLVEIVPANKTVEQTAAPSRRGAPRRDAEIPRRQPTKKDRYTARPLTGDLTVDATTRRWFWPLVAAVLMVVSGLAGAVTLYDRWCDVNLQTGITGQQVAALRVAAADAGAAVPEWGCNEGNAQRCGGGNR